MVLSTVSSGPGRCRFREVRLQYWWAGALLRGDLNQVARLLFIPMSWGRGIGPLVDCLSVARESSALGHDVAFLCRQRFSALAIEAGYEVYPNIKPPAPPTIDSDLFNVDFPVFQGLGGEEWVRKTLACEFEAIEDFQPDAVFTWLQFTATISARVVGVPIASVARWTGHPDFSSPLLDGGHFPRSGCIPLFNRILAEHGLPLVDDIWELDFLRSDLKIVPGTPELEPGVGSVSNLYYVGHLITSRVEKTKLLQELTRWALGHPTVFVYLSMKQFQPQEYAPIIRKAFNDSEFRVVVATVLKDVCPELPESTNNVRLVRWIPINAMMSISDVVISTGTRGTSWQAALHGAAHVAFPGKDPERDFVARMVETAGAGLGLPDEAFTPESILGAVREVLNPVTRARAEALGDRLRSLGGPKRAAELLVRLAQGELRG